MHFSQDLVSDPDQLVSPVCFVGKNGTGKSNALELICELFYYLDSLLLDYPAENLLSKKTFGFEIEYTFEMTWADAFDKWKDANFSWNDAYRHVKIVKKVDDKEPIYWLIDSEMNETKIQRKGDTKRDVREKIKKLLPSKIIGYSSGLNELISTPFLKMQFHYFHEYQKRLEEDVLDGFEDGRLFYMNYESNAAVVVANFLLEDERKLQVLNDTLEIADIESFRIVIEFGNYVEINSEAGSNKEKYDLTDYFKKELNNLKQIATTHKEKIKNNVLTGQSKTILTLDFKVDSSTKSAFKHFFGDTYSLYSFFHRMHLLNLYKISQEKHEAVRSAVSGVNIFNFLPKIAVDESLFRIEKVKLVKSDGKAIVEYKNISDGEHQFMHIIGTIMIMNRPKTLLILDEPETHFNPKWRSKLVNTLNKIEKAEIEVLNNSNQKRIKKSTEVILTTHSPFIISDSDRSRVWKFYKENEEPMADLIKVKTYGTSFSVLLEEAFDKPETISEMSSGYIEDLRKQIEEMELVGTYTKKTIEQFQKKVLELGESVEKFELYSYLNNLINEIAKVK